MNPFIFCATTNTRKFTVDKLQYCVSHFANIKKIIYQPTCNFDYAFVHINEWKEKKIVWKNFQTGNQEAILINGINRFLEKI